MPKPNSTVRSLPYPALEDGNFSFPDGSYQVFSQPFGNLGTEIVLRHQLTGAPFIENLISRGEAKFACSVSVPKTGYRKLHLADTSEQNITWNLDIVGEPPMLRPLILYVGDDLEYDLTSEDGVAQVWENRKIEVPKGARLARGRYLRQVATIGSLLSARIKDEMKNGSFVVTVNTNKGFYFCIEAAPDIFHFLQNPQDNLAWRDSILTHAVSQCFNILKAEYGAPKEDDDSENHWNQHSNLRALADWLTAKSMLHWSDDDFNPVKTATELYSICVPTLDKEE